MKNPAHYSVEINIPGLESIPAAGHMPTVLVTLEFFGAGVISILQTRIDRFSLPVVDEETLPSLH